MKSDPVITWCEPEPQSFTLKYWPCTNWHPVENGTVWCFLNMCRRSQLLDSFIHHPTLSSGFCPQSHKLIKTSMCAVDGGTEPPLQPPPRPPDLSPTPNTIDSALYELCKESQDETCRRLVMHIYLVHLQITEAECISCSKVSAPCFVWVTWWECAGALFTAQQWDEEVLVKLR